MLLTARLSVAPAAAAAAVDTRRTKTSAYHSILVTAYCENVINCVKRSEPFRVGLRENLFHFHGRSQDFFFFRSRERGGIFGEGQPATPHQLGSLGERCKLPSGTAKRFSRVLA